TKDRATEHRNPGQRVAEVIRLEIAGIACFSRTPETAIAGLPFHGLLRSHRVWNHVALSGSLQTLIRIRFLFLSMLDTMWMGAPGIGQGRPQRLMPGPKLGPSV